MDRPVFFGGWQRKEVVGCSSEFGHRVGFKAVVLEFDETERGESRGKVRGGGVGGEIDEWDHAVIVGSGGVSASVGALLSFVAVTARPEG